MFTILFLSAMMISPVAVNANAQTGCRDVELEKACVEALKSADELIIEHINKNKYLEAELKLKIDQTETLQKILVDANNPPWYSKKEVIFILGLITGAYLTKRGE